MTIERWRVPNGPATHVLMDGGILFVPTEETQEFYQSCVDTIKSGTKLYVVEQKTERFKFFVDLDYKAPEKLAEDDLLQFCSIIHQALDTPSRCLIARARPRPVGEGLVKSGVHIHWPDLVVTRTHALHFRSKIILKLSEDFAFDWDRIIDSSVYGGSGLRMLWSHKCPQETHISHGVTSTERRLPKNQTRKSCPCLRFAQTKRRSATRFLRIMALSKSLCGNICRVRAGPESRRCADGT